MSLRKKLVRLAYENKDLRPHLLPLLKTAFDEREAKRVMGELFRVFGRKFYDSVESTNISTEMGTMWGTILGQAKAGMALQIKFYISDAGRGLTPMYQEMLSGVRMGFTAMKGPEGSSSIFGGYMTAGDEVVADTPEDGVDDLARIAYRVIDSWL